MSMIPPLGVNQNRIQISVYDSCNCLCIRWRRRVNPDTLVYINSQGEAVKLDPNEWVNQMEAATEAVANLQRRLDEITEAHQLERDFLREQLRQRHHIELRPSTPVTLRVVRQINELLKDVLPG